MLLRHALTLIFGHTFGLSAAIPPVRDPLRALRHSARPRRLGHEQASVNAEGRRDLLHVNAVGVANETGDITNLHKNSYTTFVDMGHFCSHLSTCLPSVPQV